MRLAVLSDTHGLLRPEVMLHLRGVDAILHAGDVGKAAILDELAMFAPVHAIRGNVDTAPDLLSLPETLRLELGGVSLFMLHDLKALTISPSAAGIQIVISGHSHVPRIVTEGGVLYLNPGSCGPRRFSLPVSMALLELRPLGAQLIAL